MEFSINGQARESAATTISELLDQELSTDGPRRGLAVALNGSVVPRAQWDGTELKAGDRIEIVRALPGG